MIRHIRANAWLLFFSLLICSVIYPGILWVVGDAVFPSHASGSLLLDKNNKPVGSRLIAQPFTRNEYFQPRPSAVSFNAAASGATNWGANNYLLRNRVARQLGPIVRYSSGDKKGRLAGPDIERWFQADKYQGQPGIVARWAREHPGLAAAWIQADRLNGEYAAAWQKSHAEDAASRSEGDPAASGSSPGDLAAPFFAGFSRMHPGAFPGLVEGISPDGKTVKRIEPLREGAEIQSIFFDMWRQDHPSEDLEAVPADMVLASGSGLDPHITLMNARYQLDRVAGAWAEKTKKDPAQIRNEIQELLDENAQAPLGGLAGVPLIHVLEINLALRDRYDTGSEGKKAK